jgi:hypothetical protein
MLIGKVLKKKRYAPRMPHTNPGTRERSGDAAR